MEGSPQERAMCQLRQGGEIGMLMEKAEILRDDDQEKG